MPLSRTRALLWCAALAACSDTVRPRITPTFTVLNPEIWVGSSMLRLVSPAFATAESVAVTLDSVARVDSWRSADTLFVWIERYRPGQVRVAVKVDGTVSQSQPIEIKGVDWTTRSEMNAWTTRPLPVLTGSSIVWVGTSAGLGRADVRTPAADPVMVDSTVQPGCLATIAASEGAIVSADRGCGALRVRAYGAAQPEVDSGPPSRPWRYAAYYRGAWLLANSDSVALTVRSGDSFTWTTWRARVSGLMPSPDSRIVVATDGFGHDVLVFDLGARTLLFRDSTNGHGSQVAFSPGGDTLVYAVDTLLVIADGRTGVPLDSVVTHRAGSTYPWRLSSDEGMAWDPYRPWLYGFNTWGCPGMMVVDRRTWTIENVHGPECAGSNYVVAFSGFESIAWIMENDAPYAVQRMTIPTPRP